MICIQLLSLYSCQKETCKGVIFKEGVSYKNSQLYSGTCITHHINGEVKSIQTYKNGFDHAKWEFFYSDKTPEVIGSFNMGKKEGKWLYYHKNGILWKEHYYQDGNQKGIWKTFDENGILIEETPIFN